MLILDRLLTGLKDACAVFPDKRKGEVTYTMTDAGLSAFSLFFMQSESFLAHQRALEDERRTCNCRTLFGMAKIPTDAAIRSLLDPVHPWCLQGSFDRALAVIREGGGMKAFERLGGRALIGLDGTEFFCSRKLGCDHCRTRRRANGKTGFYHSMLAAGIAAPGHNMALPPMPEFIAKQDGAEKQDCERTACKRRLLAHGERAVKLRPIYPGGDLFACQPVCKAVTAAGGDFPMTAKRQSHIALYGFLQGAELEAILEAMTFAAMNLLAFAFHTVGDCLEELWTKARQAKRARRRFFEHIRTITAYLVFPDGDTLMTTLVRRTARLALASMCSNKPEKGLELRSRLA